DGAGGRPRDHRTGRIGDRDDGVVERALDVSVAGDHVLLFLLAHLGGTSVAACGSHKFSVSPGSRTCKQRERYLTFFLPATGLRAPLRERALVRVRWPRTGKPLR